MQDTKQNTKLVTVYSEYNQHTGVICSHSFHEKSFQESATYFEDAITKSNYISKPFYQFPRA